EAVPALIGFRQRLVLPEPVPADCRITDEQRRRGIEAADQAHNLARYLQARTQDFAAFDRGPQTIGNRLTGKVDDGVDRCVVRDVVERRDEPERRREASRLDWITREDRHVVAGFGQSFNQTAADEPGRPGDENAVALPQRRDKLFGGRWGKTT